MRMRLLVLTALFLGALPIHAQPGEILGAVSQDQARRLEEYNRVPLQQELYSAARYRIVSVNSALLLRDEAITITPFPDLKPLLVTRERDQRTDTYVNWLGRIHVDDAIFEPRGDKFYTSITMLWWDLNGGGNAELSGRNRYQFSPAWRIDENDKPVLVTQGVAVEPSKVGPPPGTPEEIAEHKRLSSLRRHAFGSFSAKLELPTGQTYIVTPLAYTPKYSVVYEVDKNKVVRMPFEPEDIASASIEEREKVQRYRAFIEKLPIEEKAILGDLE